VAATTHLLTFCVPSLKKQVSVCQTTFLLPAGSGKLEHLKRRSECFVCVWRASSRGQLPAVPWRHPSPYHHL